MSFAFTQNKISPTTTSVWHDRIFIGQIDVVMRENKELDWDAIRADKARRVSIKERWLIYYIVVPTLRVFGDTQVSGKFETKEEAAQAILDLHRTMYEEELSARSSDG